MGKLDYYFEEDSGWSLSREELKRSFDEAKRSCNTCALVVINPGNPTGQVLTCDNNDNGLILLSDEVYQDNVYDKNSKFYSFKKVAYEMGEPYCSQYLVSFPSTSKGFLGECGIRGGTGEPSYDLFQKEKSATLAAVKERAELVHKTLSSFEGYKVNPVQRPMHVFPQIEIPPKTIPVAKARGMAPNAMILPQADRLKLMIEFNFMKKYK
ncbi:alanine aminotransferase 2-like [Drosophila pseudoobscura]|uniref:alanine transaminase n=1 Tax=Drosophila pseudoobscura pseudoobscura TaxID=46245 RepID=A0A6I8WC55_DROPS|nr:alanine aminotransferase 2 [Drosophila pseudoobscura]